MANALSPAQVISVDIDEEHRIASVTVPERMLSLAIGREGQNARLAARLTGWRIDIRSDVSVAEARAAADAATNETSEEQVEGTEAVAAQASGAEMAEARGRHTQAHDEEGRRCCRGLGHEAEAAEAAAPSGEEAEPAAKPKRTTKKAAAAETDTTARSEPRRQPTTRPRSPPSRQAQAGLKEGSPRTHRGGGVVAGAPGSVAPRRTPNRTCVACRTVRPKRDLQRIVRTPAGDIVVDETGRPAGRGAYVCRTEACLDKALAKGALSRALKTPLPPDVRAQLAGSLTTNPTHE